MDFGADRVNILWIEIIIIQSISDEIVDQIPLIIGEEITDDLLLFDYIHGCISQVLWYNTRDRGESQPLPPSSEIVTLPLLSLRSAEQVCERCYKQL